MKFNKVLSKLIVFLIFGITVQGSFGQVGIGTTTPTHMLDVNGNVIVGSGTNTGILTLVAADAAGVLTNIGISTDLVLNNGRLSTKGTISYDIVTIDWRTINTCPTGNETVDNINMNIAGTNRDKIVFKIINTGCTTNIKGIAGGEDGRHIYFYHTGTNTININNMDSSIPENNIDTLTGGKIVLNGRASVELIYDGLKKKWIVISIIS